MIVVTTQTGSRYEIQSDGLTDEMCVTRDSDSEVYDLNSKTVNKDINNYLAREPITDMIDPPLPGERWTFWTKHGRLQTSPVAYVNYVHEDGSLSLYDIYDQDEDYY